jgi:hypothetical protein
MEGNKVFITTVDKKKDVSWLENKLTNGTGHIGLLPEVVLMTICYFGMYYLHSKNVQRQRSDMQ